MSAFRFAGGAQEMSDLPCTQPSTGLRGSMPRLAALVVGLTLVLFPFGWLGEVWRPFGRLVDDLFSTVWAHAIGHASLFCMLGLLALAIFPALRRHPWRYFGLLLLAGVGQEAFQLLYKGRLLLFDDLRDLATDLAGLLLAFVIVWVWRWLRSRSYGDLSNR
jgi:hypothetical protein